MCGFQWKTSYILETVKDGPRLLLITNRKWDKPWKSLTLDDLEGRYRLLWINGKVAIDH